MTIEKRRRTRFKRLQDDPGFPKLVYAEIHPTDICNLKCYFCNQAVYRKTRQVELPWKLLHRTLIGMQELGLSMVRLSGGGEPILHPQFNKIIEFLSRHDIMLKNLTTNGLLCEGETLDALLSLNWRHALISLAAHEQKDWMRVTKGSAKSYNRVIRNIENILERRNLAHSPFPKIALMFGIDHITYKKLTDAYEFACNLGVDGVLFKTFNNTPYPPAMRKDSSRILDQLHDICVENGKTKKIKYLLITLRDLKLNTDIVDQVISDSHETNAYLVDNSYELCFMPWHGTAIRANGDVIPCCAGIGGFTRMGNIHDDSIARIWRGENYRKLREMFEAAMHDESPSTGRQKRIRLPLQCIASHDENTGCPVKIGWEQFIESY